MWIFKIKEISKVTAMKNISSILCLVFMFLLHSNISYTQDTPEFLIDTSIVFGNSSDYQGMPAIAFDGTNYLIVWEDDHSGNVNICGTFVDQSGRVLNSYGINITNSSDDHFTPDIAFDGTNYLVVWSEDRNGNQDIIGTRINTEGVILDPQGIQISAAPENQMKPAITFGGAYYFVAWGELEDTHIYGTRISPSGIVQDSLGINISDSVGTASWLFEIVLACDDTNYLVSWYKKFDGYYGSRVNQKGEVIDTIEIYTCANPGGGCMAGPCIGASLAFDGDNYLFVGAWCETYCSVIGLLLSTSGSVIDSFGISSGIDPSVSYNNDHYIVSFKQCGMGGGPDVFGRRIDKSGLVLDSIDIQISHLPNSSYEAWNPVVASGGINSFVIWEERSEIVGSRVDKKGDVLDPDGILISTDPQSQFSPSITSDGSNYFVIWKDNRYDYYDIYGTRVNQSGATLDPEGILIHKCYREEFIPKVTFGGSYYLTVWIGYEPSRRICRARIDQSGILIDTSSVAIWNYGLEWRPSIASDGDKYLIASEIGASGRNIFGLILIQSGAIMNTFPISIIEQHQKKPSIAFNGYNYLVVWQNGFGSRDWDIYGTLVSRSGIVFQPEGIQICIDQGFQVHPAVASNGKDFLVVWQDSFESNNNIYGIRVDSSGNLIDPEAFPISIAEGDQIYPSVAFNGADYIVVWQDFRNGSDYDIYGAKVNTDGSVVDSFIVSNAVGDQLAPEIAYSSGNQVLVTYSGWTGEYNSKIYNCMRIWGKYLGNITGIDEQDKSEIVTEYNLQQCYPNPFNPSTTIQYSIKERTPVELVLFDILGREVALLVNEEQDAGYYKLNFNAGRLASGIYFYQLRAGDYVETKKMVLLR